jgi:hypothetical protein
MKRMHGGKAMTWKKQADDHGESGDRNGQDRPDDPTSDYLWDALEQNWPSILKAYRLCQDQDLGPVVLLYDMQEKRVYGYRFPEFKEDMAEAARQALQEQQDRAASEGKLLVFVRDNEKRRLVSVSMVPE